MAVRGDKIRRWYNYTGGEVVPDHVTQVQVTVDASVTIIPEGAFEEHPNIEEVYCHAKVEKIGHAAFAECPSLRRVSMPGVEDVKEEAFYECKALIYVECDNLGIIGYCAFNGCESLRDINLLSNNR